MQQQAMRTWSVVFAGGGTGGHIFPAMAIAQQAVKQHAALLQGGVQTGGALRCEFVVSQRPLDAKILQNQRLGGEGVVFHCIPAQPAAMGPRGLYRFVTSWGSAVRASRQVLQRLQAQGPVVVVATGGFVAAPVAQAARVQRVPVIMVNLDAIPGKANRWIGKTAARRLTALAIAPQVKMSAKDKPWEVLRPIVREAIVSSLSVIEARQQLGLDAGKPTLLVTGGSQGAGSINDLLRCLITSDMVRSLQGWQVLHQAGEMKSGAMDAQALQAAYREAGISAKVVAFLDRMELAWRASDLAICRAGAGNVSEVWATQTPAIFLPYPYHKDQHQKWNAQPLVDAHAGVLATDFLDAQRTLEGVRESLQRLLEDARARQELRANLQALGPADGAAAIASRAMGVLGGGK